MRSEVVNIIRKTMAVFALLLLCREMQAQQSRQLDTVFFLAKKRGLLGKIGKSLSVNIPDPPLPRRGVIKTETEYAKYRGKIIRNIFVKKTGFIRSVNDTTRAVRNFFNEVGDALHPNTRDRVILNNIFFSKGDTLYPYLLADNETFLRTLTYLQDAKITVQEDERSTDSVDVIVICKDVFPIGGSMEEGNAREASFEMNDDNLFGTGNRIQMRNYINLDRRPGYGFGFEFIKRNLWGTFLNATIGFDNAAPAFNTGKREEKAIYARGDLPLVSPYHVWTGGFDIGTHRTQDVFPNDSVDYHSIFKYNYRLFDAWIGYNIGAHNLLRENFSSRKKKVVAVRYINRKFLDIPNLYYNNYQIMYSNLVSALGSFTIFEQDFYHTNFLYGFGRNEDVPEGFTMSFIGGWSNRNNVSRPYAGFDYQRNYFSKKSNYLKYNLRFGGYYNNGRFEDMSILNSIEYFTRLRKLGNSGWFLRHFMSGSVTQLMNTYLNEPLRLSSDYGIPRLDNPNLFASTRITFNHESVFYNTWKLVGFSFAPFAFGNISYVKPIGSYVKTGDIYTAIGGGVRTRNENLVFGTIELKAFYYPRITRNMSQWNITINTDIRFKYNTQLIRQPDFVNVNDNR